MTVCLIGNSQLICLKHGFPHSGLGRDDFVFWGTAGRGFRTVKFDAGRLLPDPKDVEQFRSISDGLYGELPIEDFDALSFHGCFALHVAIKDVLTAKKKLRFMSSALLDALVRDIVLQTKAFELASEIRRTSRIKILISVNPMPTDGIHEKNFPSEVASRVIGIARQVASELSVELIEQPAETLTADRLATKENYSFRGDRTHMNAAFGALVLQEMKPHLPSHRRPLSARKRVRALLSRMLRKLPRPRFRASRAS